MIQRTITFSQWKCCYDSIVSILNSRTRRLKDCHDFSSKFGTKEGIKIWNDLSFHQPIRKLLLRWVCNLYHACSYFQPEVVQRVCTHPEMTLDRGHPRPKSVLYFRRVRTGRLVGWSRELGSCAESHGNLLPIQCWRQAKIYGVSPQLKWRYVLLLSAQLSIQRKTSLLLPITYPR